MPAVSVIEDCTNSHPSRPKLLSNSSIFEELLPKSLVKIPSFIVTILYST